MTNDSSKLKPFKNGTFLESVESGVFLFLSYLIALCHLGNGNCLRHLVLVGCLHLSNVSPSIRSLACLDPSFIFYQILFLFG